MEPPFRIEITETTCRILPLHMAEKNTAKYSIKRIEFILKRCLTLEKKILAPFLCTKFILHVLSASGI